MGILGSVGSALGGGLTSGLDKALSGWLSGEIGGHYDRKMLKYQNDLMRQNWEMVNEYNKPSAQMARYAEAGLNPNLIYGQDNTSGSIGTPSAMSKASPAGATMDLWQRMKQMDADTENKYKQNSLLQSQSDYVKAQTKGQELENDVKQKVLDSLGGFNTNPNDPYWYRDAKKLIHWLFNEPSMSGTGVPAVPQVSRGVFDYIPEHPVREYARKPRGRLIIQGDRGGRK